MAGTGWPWLAVAWFTRFRAGRLWHWLQVRYRYCNVALALAWYSRWPRVTWQQSTDVFLATVRNVLFTTNRNLERESGDSVEVVGCPHVYRYWSPTTDKIRPPTKSRQLRNKRITKHNAIQVVSEAEDCISIESTSLWLRYPPTQNARVRVSISNHQGDPPRGRPTSSHHAVGHVAIATGIFNRKWRRRKSWCR